ncbi:MAG: glycosyltransferase family 2 protein [Candidatus Schekmanbacteria bacterium]|nr:glycosyltransferase family 2 protein [Candidatus Schekmanbacteria bacterium]
MPLVSVIIPTFNREWIVAEAIRSVLAQRFHDFELIVVDDGSTDNTRSKIQPFIESFKDKLKYIYQKNSGVSSARNQGIKNSRGSLICFLDSDDLWHRDKLKEQVSFMEKNPDFKICYTDEKWFKNGEHLNQSKHHKKYSGDIFRYCLPLCIISASSVMIAREVFDDVGFFDESLEVCEDYDLWLRIALKYKIHFIEKKLIVKRGGHSDQLSKKYWGMDRFRVEALLKLLNSELPEEQKKYVIEELKKKCVILSKGFKKRGKISEAQIYEKILCNLNL